MMATFYHGNSDIQGGGDGLQTLILMNPGYVAYPETHPQSNPHPHGNFVFLNPAGNAINPPNLIHSPTTQQFVGIPLHQPNISTPIPSFSQEISVHPQHDISSLQGFVHRVQHNPYNPLELTAARDITRGQRGGLSLTLSSQQQQQSGYQAFRLERDVPSQTQPPTIPPPSSSEDIRASHGLSSPSASGISNGANGMRSVLLNSKYLKAAQELLDEVVNVDDGIKKSSEFGSKEVNDEKRQFKTGGDLSPVVAAEKEEQIGSHERSEKQGAELSTAERQEIQMKKGKLVSMLDEVEQRYREYHHQMQIVISWFEQVAGIGSAKTYTALALQTISKQFRCLKDAILGQIRAASKTLGEEDYLGGKIEGSKLKFVDNQLRQQRALQQLGMIQHNAWRPQRGLPERAVSVLRAWLFEHFLHPYPKDSDKIMLAKQTNLTRSQVSNWFINARVRLWKPMVEEMYMEEIKEQEQNGSEEKTNKGEQKEDGVANSMIDATQEKSSASEIQNESCVCENITVQYNAPQASNSTAATSHSGINMQSHPCGFNLIMSASKMESITQGSPKKSRSSHEMLLHSPTSVQSKYMDTKESIKFGDEERQQNRDGFTMIGGPTNFMGGFGMSSYHHPIGTRIAGAEQFCAPYNSGSGGVSLTLGLQHCENLSSIPGTQQTFLPRQNQNIQLGRRVGVGETDDFSGGAPMASAHSANIYENFNIQNRKRLAAQLLPDFVA